MTTRRQSNEAQLAIIAAALKEGRMTTDELDALVAVSTAKQPLILDEGLLKRFMRDRRHGSPAFPVVITPALASLIMQQLNTRNRHLKTADVRAYAEDMLADKWLLNGEPVKFTDKLRLGDGQNRLAACMRSQTPFVTYVVFGIPDDYFYSLDQGRKRSGMDVLELAGVEHYGPVAVGVRWAELIATKQVKRRTVFRPPTTLDLFTTKHSTIEDFYPEARAVSNVTDQPVGMVMAVLYHFNRIDPDLAADLAEAWSTGTFTARFAPLRQLGAAIAALKKKSRGRVHEVVRLAMIVNAWNLIRAGRAKGAINWDLNRPFPEIK